MECKLEALHNYVILKLDKKAAMKGNIHLPESAVEDQADFAKVISVGPACEGDIKFGDLVLCPEVGDTEWTDEDDKDQRYMLIEETAIAARVRQ
jgi:co-chaperonin GroES (HSP10)